MTGPVTEQVWRNSASRNGARLVLLALAFEADRNEGHVRLAEDELARRTCFSARHVRNCLVELQRAGELELVRRGGGRHNPNEYVLHLGAVPDGRSVDVAEDEDGSHVPATDADFPEVHASTRKSGASKGNRGSRNSETVVSRTPARSTPFGSTPSPSRQAGSLEVPEAVRPLVEQLTAAGMLVGWGLNVEEWRQAEQLVDRVGVEALVEYAARRWDAARPPRSARYLLRMWSDLPTPGCSAPDNVVALRAREPWQPYRAPVETAAYERGF